MLLERQIQVFPTPLADFLNEVAHVLWPEHGLCIWSCKEFGYKTVQFVNVT